MSTVIPFEGVEEPVQRFLKGLGSSNGTSLVDVDDRRVYLVVRPSRDRTATGPWTEEKSRKRFELIDRELDGTISPGDSVELVELDEELDEFVNRIAPLPMEHARAIQTKLLEAVRLAETAGSGKQ